MVSASLYFYFSMFGLQRSIPVFSHFQSNFRSCAHVFRWYGFEFTVHHGRSDEMLQTTQPTRGRAVTAVWQTLCKMCRPLPPPAMGARLPFFGAGRPCGSAGGLTMLLIKSVDVETIPGPTTTPTVWIFDISHIQIQVRKQISIRCNMIEHWVPLRCTGIRLAQYPDTWTCHQHM